MNELDVTTLMRERLDTCPNCGGILAQKTAYTIQCETCSYEFRLRTPFQKWGVLAILWCLMLMMLVLGYVLRGF